MKREEVARRLRTILADLDELAEGEPACLGPDLLVDMDEMRDDLAAIANDLDGQDDEPEELAAE